VIHAVAATPEKTWRADGFVAVARASEESGLEAVFIGAAGDDLRPFGAFRYRIVQDAPLGQVKSIARRGVFVRGQR
jgi:hypothetical protein